MRIFDNLNNFSNSYLKQSLFSLYVYLYFTQKAFFFLAGAFCRAGFNFVRLTQRFFRDGLRYARRLFARGWQALCRKLLDVCSSIKAFVLVLVQVHLSIFLILSEWVDWVYFITPFVCICSLFVIHTFMSLIVLLMQIHLILPLVLVVAISGFCIFFGIYEDSKLAMYFRWLLASAISPLTWLTRILEIDVGAFLYFLQQMMFDLYEVVMEARPFNDHPQIKHLVVRLVFDLVYVLCLKYTMFIPLIVIGDFGVTSFGWILWWHALKYLTKVSIVQSMLRVRLLRLVVRDRDWLKRVAYREVACLFMAPDGYREVRISEPEKITTLRRVKDEPVALNVKDQASELLVSWGDEVIEEANSRLSDLRKEGKSQEIPASLRENQLEFSLCSCSFDLPLTGYAMKRELNGEIKYVPTDYIELMRWVREKGKDYNGTDTTCESIMPDKEANLFISQVMAEIWPAFEARHSSDLNKVHIACHREESRVRLSAHAFFRRCVRQGGYLFETIAYA